MIPVEDYLAKILEGVRPLPTVQTPLLDALGTVVARDLKAQLAVPPFTNSAMDGFAVRFKDVRGTNPDHPTQLPVQEDLAAGVSGEHALKPGNAARIMTGAPIPVGADTVVKVEDTNIAPGPTDLPGTVTFYQVGNEGANVRAKGEDVNEGEVVIHAGEEVTPALISAAASVGYSELPVHAQPRVAVVSTGEELVAPGRELSGGQIPDSNSLLLAALAQTWGSEVVFRGRSGDSPEALAQVYDQAAEQADLIITSGGVSAGAFDVVKALGMEHGFEFTKVCMQPGKPQGHGHWETEGRRVKAINLPGNPVSVFVSFTLFVRPVLAAMAGRSEKLATTHAIAATGWKSAKNRRQYAPVVARQTDRGLEVTPTHVLAGKSHLVATLPRATGLAVIPAATSFVDEGSSVAYIRL